MSKYVMAYDIGTTGIKTCLIEIDKEIKILASATEGYNLYVDEETGVKGGSEQDADEWWSAMCITTKEVLKKCRKIKKEQIEGISFCSAMQGLVLVDREGKCIRRPMTYMDQRAREEIKKGIAHGVQIAGAEVTKLLKYLKYTGAVSSSVKDPIWKYKWVEAHEPENFKRIYKWLDVKEYMILRCSGEFVMTNDSAFGTLLYDTRKGHEGWCKPICDMVGVNIEHMPEIKASTEKVGEITKQAAEELGLAEGTAVYGGGGDASLIGVGAGATEIGDTHVYSGTSGWVGTVVPEQLVDAGAMMAAIVGANPETYNYFAELETSNKCMGWVKDHLALDEIGVFLKKYGHKKDDLEEESFNLYDYLEEVIDRANPGADGVVFTPWLHGNRCPFEDPNAAGMFFNIHLETGKTELIRAVVEGVCFHMRWMLERQEQKVAKYKTTNAVRFCGGGALGASTCQILADILQRDVEVVDSPQNIGAVGAAACIAVGTGMIGSMTEVKKLIPAKITYHPNKANKAVYDRN
ncbi:MAG: FGGY-family carbohydrate kinase, partial [Eubacterium coprostanoligenes]|nr:FGGY-family carbohydrate kinase [Eubacterium coprostanoligenes]